MLRFLLGGELGYRGRGVQLTESHELKRFDPEPYDGLRNTYGYWERKSC